VIDGARITAAPSLTVFKGQLKTFLINIFRDYDNLYLPETQKPVA